MTEEKMMIEKKRIFLFAFTFALLGIIVGLGISLNLNLNTAAYSEEHTISKDAIELLSKTDRAMAEVAAAVKPAVVNISSTRTVKTQGIANPLQNDPFFNRFFGDQFNGFGKPRK